MLLIGAELVWLGRQDQEQSDWTMEQKILEILEISRKNQPQEFDRLQVFILIFFTIHLISFSLCEVKGSITFF